MAAIKFEVIKVEQPIGIMYIGKIEGNKLFRMAKADIRKLYNNEDYLGIQRPLDPGRVKNIKQYVKTSDASFPNSIILNLKSEYLYEESDNALLIEINENAFSIIDGQHRLSGFEDFYNGFELIVTIFIDLDDEQQALLFKTINSEQKKVDPSFKYDLEAYSTVKTPEKVIRDLTLAFNIDENSPWYSKIKMTGRKDELSKKGVISQKAFADPIVKYIYNERNDKYKLRDELIKYKRENNLENNFNVNGILNPEKYESKQHILWHFYYNDKEEVLYKILNNYYKGIHEHLSIDWEHPELSIVTKTTGYNAFMKLFKDIYELLYKKRSFTFDSFSEILEPISTFSGKITALNYGSSGESSSERLYKDLYAEVIKNRID